MGRRETSASVWQKNAEKNDITFQYVYTHLLWAFVTAVHQRHYRARFTSFPLDNPSSFFLFHGEIKSISPRVCLSILQCHPLYPDCLVLPSHCRCWFQSWSSSLSVFQEKLFFFLFIFAQIPSISTGRRHRVFWEWTSRMQFHDYVQVVQYIPQFYLSSCFFFIFLIISMKFTWTWEFYKSIVLLMFAIYVCLSMLSWMDRKRNQGLFYPSTASSC